MRKILPLLLFCILVLSSCAVSSPFYGVGFYDYSALTRQGIFVSESNSVNFEYEALGSIFGEGKAGWIRKSKNVQSSKDELFVVVHSSKYYEKPDINKLLIVVGDKLKELGADGIINLNIQYVPYNDKHTEKFVLSGMAIKRKW